MQNTTIQILQLQKIFIATESVCIQDYYLSNKLKMLTTVGKHSLVKRQNVYVLNDCKFFIALSLTFYSEIAWSTFLTEVSKQSA